MKKLTQEEKPTAIGLQKYEPDGMYEGVPCTCFAEACKFACKGDCGCRACQMAFADFGYDES